MRAHHELSLKSAISLIIANAIGAGALTSLGFQLVSFSSPTVIMCLWIVGGILALCGSFVYSELESRIPGNGGEAHFMEELYGPAWGFITGWVSLLAGFAIPLAATAYACARYMLPLGTSLSTTLIVAASLLALATGLNARSSKLVSRVQNFFVVIKVSLILGLSYFLFKSTKNPQHLDWSLGKAEVGMIMSAPFALALVYVNFAYSGWNAVVYIAKEIKNKEKNLPRALLLGSALITFVYLVFNLSMLSSTPLELMRGKVEVAALVANYHFPAIGSTLTRALCSMSLFTCLTSVLWAGSRVMLRVEEKNPLLSFLFLKKLFPESLSLLRALFVISLIALMSLLSMSFQTMINATGFVLVFFSFMCGIGLLWIKAFPKNKGVVSSQKIFSPFFSPITTTIFLLANFWIAVFLFQKEYSSIAWGFGVIFLGVFLYYMQKYALKVQAARAVAKTRLASAERA